MVLDIGKGYPISAAFFCPQSRAPDEEYLAGLHLFLRHNQHGQIILQELAGLDRIWTIFANARDDIHALSQGPMLVNMLQDWAKDGNSGPLAAARSGIVSLPLLLVLQIGQYLRYLEVHGLSHHEFVADVQHAGGLQGYCGGLPAAIAIACAKDEKEVVRNAAIILRVTLGVGAYSEAADDMDCTTVALRLKYAGQEDELVCSFPGTYVSAITDPRSVSIVGPAVKVNELTNYARGQGLQVQKVDIWGKVHNPENKDIAAELCRLCSETPCLQLPEALELQASVRSNKSGERLLRGSLIEELVTTILASRCCWYSLLNEVAEDLKASRRPAHTCVIFGLSDCVPMSPFHRRRLKVSKFEAHGLIQKVRKSKDHNAHLLDSPSLQGSAIAVVGASCRLPGASNLEELWNMLVNGIDRHQEVLADRFDLHGSFRASQSGRFASERKFYGNFLDDVRRFDHTFFGVSPREAANMDPQQRILLELSFEALEASGYLATHRREAGDNVGCFIGTALVEYLDNTNAHGPTAFTATGTHRAFLCGKLSHYYGWCGPSEAIDTVCSSSLVAINRACKAIQAGECSMALAGGVNIITGFNGYLDLSKAGFLNHTGQCKPFDQSADGYCRSDGAGLVVLKKLKQAISDGDQIWGIIPSIATNQGGLSTSITVPHSAALQALYRTIIQQSGLQPEQVTYVEAHGTGTQAGDPVEMESIRSVFGSPSRSDTLYIGSIKGNIGHCESAAGVAGLLKVLAMIKHGQIPPQANHHRLNPKIPHLQPDGLDIPRNLCFWDVPFRAALINSYGASGSNCALLCCEMAQRNQEAQTISIQSSETSFPILLSAASQKSLLDHAQTLGAYLRQNSTSLDIGDISFTLNVKRQRHKHFITTTSRSAKDLADQLLSLKPSTCLDLPQKPKPVILSFSGQYDNKVALKRTFYDSYPIFRSYIDACDAEVRSLGFCSIIPAIFQTQPISDVVTLQCSMFATQYACAQSWVDAGLKISAVVGHSFGELTALAVSGALSLSDSIKLITSRGHLVESQWGPEKGAMLALHCDIDGFKKILSCLPTDTENGKLEIACYNAPTSLIAVGTSTTIDTAEKLIRTEPSLQKIRCQRLETTHGFHSALTEPILADLTNISKSLHWKEPKIPLEVCKAERLRSVKDYSVSRHARESVFFFNAVRRLEDSLGACVWLEAGVGTPIMPMVRKASKQPEVHSFHAMKVQGDRKPVDAVSDVVSSLWKSGISVIHWSFLPAHTRKYKQIWLPPYQFEKTPHWRENIDRTIEMQQVLSNSTPAAVTAGRSPSPSQLVARKEMTAEHPGIAEFLVNTRSLRFQKIVAGHALCQRPLCPASMYLECVTMAIQLLIDGIGNASLVFEQVVFHAALGLSLDCEVVIQLEELPNEQSWKFIIRSLVPTCPRSKQISHGNGIVSLVSNPLLNPFKRLIPGLIERLEKKKDIEKLMSKRAYGLFASVVDYDHFFQGIFSVKLDDWEAVATISLPDNQPNREESTSWRVCDAVTVDSFIQVLGLLMNSSDVVSRGEILVMIGVERAVISPACKMDDPKNWRVFAKFCVPQDEQPIGDIFVCSPEGEMVVMLCGCQFKKILISKLEKVLDSANSRVSQEIPESPRNQIQADSSTTVGESIITPAMTIPTQETNDELLRELIANVLCINKPAIPKDTILADLGLDSLGSVELVGELLSRFGLSITSDDLAASTLNDLNQRLGISDFDIESTQPASGVRSGLKHVEEHLYGLLEPKSERRRQQFLNILIEVLGVKLENIEPTHTLVDLGVDSLSSIELKQELKDSFSVQLDELHLDRTVNDLMTLLNIEGPKLQHSGLCENLIRAGGVESGLVSNQKENLALRNPLDVLKQSDIHFNDSANKCGFIRYWSDVAPFQNELLLAYIVEGFSTMGINLSRILPGSNVPQVSHLEQKYDKLVLRLWKILQKHGIVIINQAGNIIRGGRRIDMKASSQLLDTIRAQFPAYKHESNLIGLIGPRLADCLSGKADPVSIMFGSSASLKIMEDFYSHSPIFSTLAEQLVIFMTTLFRGLDIDRPVRILEVGADTGASTKRLVEALDSAGIAVQYMFSDISPSFISKARDKFKQYPWVEFATFNLENDVPDAFRGRFDIVVGASCVHATTNRTASCQRLREALTEDGFIVLSEITRIIDWHDMCFGLLDGWWLGEGHPIQSAEVWMSTFEEAGFASSGYSRGPTLEANSQQLLVACRKQWDTSAPLQAMSDAVHGEDGEYHLETMVYKEVDGVQIHADIFFPRNIPVSPLAIALMIHGGGFMTLSRKSIRPIQTRHLLANGFLPVSIDYRLCPEVSLIDGPMTDVCDAYQWTRTALSQIAARRGLEVDSNKVVIVGWSTGGQLAMSIGWTAKTEGIPPPTAVLSFYAPVDFESGELHSKYPSGLPSRSMSMESIISALPRTPITNYDYAEADSSNHGWVVRPGDPRSELALSLFEEGNGFPILLNGLPHPTTPREEWFLPPSPARVAAVSPLAQLRRGAYDVPTFVIHGTHDKVAPFAGAERFVAELRNKNIRHGFLPLQGVGHIHDLKLRPGSRGWEAQVAPGYRFLFGSVKDDVEEQSG